MQIHWWDGSCWADDLILIFALIIGTMVFIEVVVNEELILLWLAFGRCHGLVLWVFHGIVHGGLLFWFGIRYSTAGGEGEKSRGTCAPPSHRQFQIYSGLSWPIAVSRLLLEYIHQ